MKKNLSIREKTLLAALAPGLLTFILFIILMSMLLYKDLKIEAENHANRFASSIAQSKSLKISADNKTELEDLACVGVHMFSEVSRIEILDNLMNPIASCSREKTGPVNNSISVITEIKKSHDGKWQAGQGPAHDGYVSSLMSEDYFHKDILSSVARMLWVGCLVTAVTLVFSFLITRRHANNMEELAVAIKNFADGNYSPQFTPNAKGEIGELQKAFLDMASVFRGATERLEDSVNTRTNELQQQINDAEIANQERKALIVKINSKIEDERRSISFDVHDTLNTIILSLIGNARQIQTFFDSHANKSALAPAVHFVTQIDKNSRYLYELTTNLINKLRPQVLDDFGLDHALRTLIVEHEKTQTLCKFRFTTTPDFPTLTYDFNIIVYRIVQESLSNISKHSEARECDVILTGKQIDNQLHFSLLIYDNGGGFDVKKAHQSVGLIGMRERAEAINGRFTIDSSPEDGTEIRLKAIVALT